MFVPEWLNLGGFLAMALLLFAARLVGKGAAFVLVGFYLPFLVPGFQVGINLYWPLILGPLGIALGSWHVRNGASDTGPLRTFVVYVSVVTFVWIFLEFGVLSRHRLLRQIGLGAFQSDYVQFVQLLSFLFQVSIFLVPWRLARSPADIDRAQTAYLLACIVSGLFGMALVVVTGQGFVNREATQSSMGGLQITRVGGLSGEPKMLGAFLVIAMVFLLSRFVDPSRNRSSMSRIMALVVSGVVLYFTYSTSSWLGLAAAVASGLALVMVQRGARKAALLVVVLAAAGLAPIVLPHFQEAYEYRVQRRVFDPETSEVQSSKSHYVVDVFTRKPYAVFTGFGSGGLSLEAAWFMLHDPRYWRERQYVRVPTPGVNMARWFGEYGIIGFVLMGLMVFRWYKILIARGDPAGALFVAAGFVAMLLISANAVPPYFFLVGGILYRSKLKSASGLKHSHTVSS